MYKIYIKYTKLLQKKFLYCKMLLHFVGFLNYDVTLFLRYFLENGPGED